MYHEEHLLRSSLTQCYVNRATREDWTRVQYGKTNRKEIENKPINYDMCACICARAHTYKHWWYICTVREKP